ncbi:MAG: GNAT family N-acetyltransferase [Muribaculaceae bacterium]|nr:GNAT family N-acetyltransferase [Muribaculaceae bacterium]
MEPVIDAVNPSLIEAELTEDRLLRETNKAGNRIYVVDAHNAPNTMREIGRLRELAFRAGGGGTGKGCDIDEFDTMENPCQQLLVWNPDRRNIVGAYRYILGTDMERDANGRLRIAMGHMFDFSQQFVDEYLPCTIELGRSFVSLEYQSTRAGNKALYALDNLWDGLGALSVIHPDIKYFFGKMTMYPSYDRECRDRLLEFLRLYFPDRDQLVTPIEPLEGVAPGGDGFFGGGDFKADYKTLNAFVRNHGINIPPLVNAYMALSPTMRVFGTAINHEFGKVEETGIFIKIDEIAESKKSRHIDSFKQSLHYLKRYLAYKLKL